MTTHDDSRLDELAEQVRAAIADLDATANAPHASRADYRAAMDPVRARVAEAEDAYGYACIAAGVQPPDYWLTRAFQQECRRIEQATGIGPFKAADQVMQDGGPLAIAIRRESDARV